MAKLSSFSLFLEPVVSPGAPLPTQYSRGEELANTVTHGVGALLGLTGWAVLVGLTLHLGGDAWQLVSFSIYGCSLFLLYLFSALYHGIHAPGPKALLKKLDHAAIFLLIAGTYTPLLLVSLRSTKGWILLAVVWSVALAGIAAKMVFGHRLRKTVTAVPYLVLGWLCMFMLPEMIAELPAGTLTWLISGGVFYSGGVAFYVWKRLAFNHAIWHLFVLSGSVCHFLAVFLHLAPG